MKKISPHLPVPSCNLYNHRLWQRLKFLLFVAFFSLAVSMSGAAMVLGWIWPSVGAGDIWITSYQRPAISRNQLEDRVHSEIASRIIYVYQSASNLSEPSKSIYLDDQLKLGEAILVSSDGWVVMYKPDFVLPGKNNKMMALSQDDRVYEIEKQVNDKNSGLVYLKIKSGQFKVVNFSETIKNGDEVFVYDGGDWNYSLIGQRSYLTKQKLRLDTAPASSYFLSGSFGQGKIVVNGQGRVVGISMGQGKMLPNTYITRMLSEFLNKKSLEYPSLGVNGWFSQGQPVIINGLREDGFVIDGVWQEKSLLRVGDFITEINGLLVDEANLWYTLSNNQKVKIKLLRNGKLLELELPVVKKTIDN
ncbi:MAG: S1C family serine protease [bacterium]